MKNSIFKAEKNLLNDNQIIIYEYSPNGYIYRFAIDKANFENDKEFENFIHMIIENLNKQFN